MLYEHMLSRIKFAMVLCVACVLGVSFNIHAQMIKDAQGKDSGFEHVMTFGSKGTGDGQFSYPEDFDLTADKKYILVTDAVNANVQVFDGLQENLSRSSVAKATRIINWISPREFP